MSDISTSLLCIELDCLLDTRLATLYQLDPAAAKKVLTSGYHDRVVDAFPVDLQRFRQRYKDRDRTVLKDSIMTPLVRLCREFVQATLQQSINSPYQYIPKIAVNVHPYRLELSEQESISRAIATAVRQHCDIQLIDYAPEILTPQWVKQECSILVMYDYPAWLELHSVNENWKHVSCPEVTLMGPALYFNGLPSDSALAEAKALQTTPFEALEQIAGPLIQLSLLPVRYFSVAVNIPQEEALLPHSAISRPTP